MVNSSKNSSQVCVSVLFCVIVSFMSIILGLFMDLWFYSTLYAWRIEYNFGAFVSRTKELGITFYIRIYRKLC